jgi:hypothetical protein
MMQRRTLFLSGMVLFGLICFPLTNSVKASLEMLNQTYGETTADYAYSLVATSDGGFALAGSTQPPTIELLLKPADFWLVKTDANGVVEWNRTYGGAGFDVAYSLVATSDRGFALAGYTGSFGAGSTDFWLVKTDAYGNMMWNRTYGGAIGEVAFSLVATSDGGFALAGSTDSFGTGIDDFWLVKTDMYGNMEWSQTYGGANGDYVYSLVATSDGGYALAGDTKSFGTGYADFWLVKTDANGVVEWNQTYGRTGYDVVYSLVATSDGGYALSGYTDPYSAEYADFWLVKTDAYGNMMWNQTYGGAGIDSARSLVATSDGGFALAGSTDSFGAGDADFWLVKTDAYGNMKWNHTYGGAMPASEPTPTTAPTPTPEPTLTPEPTPTTAPTPTPEPTPIPEPFPTTWIAPAIGIAAIGGAVFLVYFKKIKKKT